eukprot:TRINITY_DN6370_c1_g3_i1.p1 TRINITY_DN6370_c1_g3~~TRINITY_DN6370_c1_g3_i1.p1  ORF type:complete len:169 (-),score=3.08 TRINITY_DN6370_c1_g3_i1:6-512(-)
MYQPNVLLVHSLLRITNNLTKAMKVFVQARLGALRDTIKQNLQVEIQNIYEGWFCLDVEHTMKYQTNLNLVEFGHNEVGAKKNLEIFIRKFCLVWVDLVNPFKKKDFRKFLLENSTKFRVDLVNKSLNPFKKQGFVCVSHFGLQTLSFQQQTTFIFSNRPPQFYIVLV